jgi:hypothetical protein
LLLKVKIDSSFQLGGDLNAAHDSSAVLWSSVIHCFKVHQSKHSVYSSFIFCLMQKQLNMSALAWFGIGERLTVSAELYCGSIPNGTLFSI